jgi:hypothetical protein
MLEDLSASKEAKPNWVIERRRDLMRLQIIQSYPSASKETLETIIS